MPTGDVINFNNKKMKAVLSEFFDNMNVGDMCTMHEILEYLSKLPMSKIKNPNDRDISSNRKSPYRQLYTSKDYFSRVCANIPNVMRGTVYSRSSKFMMPLVLFVKTNENRDTVCFNCEEYLVGGAKGYVDISRKTPIIGKHIMCEECYRHEVKMFSPHNEHFAKGFDMAYEKWEKKRDWSEEE